MFGRGKVEEEDSNVEGSYEASYEEEGEEYDTNEGGEETTTVAKDSLDEELTKGKGEGGGGMFSMFQRKKDEYIEPNLPYMGPPLKYLKVVERMKVAKPVARKLLENAGRRVADSIQEGATVPVDMNMERIKVSTLAQDRIGQRRTKKAIHATVENNLHEIKQTLNWRKIALDMMNHNTSKVCVRNLENEKLDLPESRTNISVRDDGAHDSDMW